MIHFIINSLALKIDNHENNKHTLWQCEGENIC